MRKVWTGLSILALCVAALCLTAAAAEPLAPTRAWGKVTPWEGEGILLKNDNPNDPLNEVVVHLGEAPVVDAVTGLPLDPASIKEGDALYVWLEPAMALSMPPQASAIVVVGNIPADAAAPQYYEIAGAPVTGEDGVTSFPLVGGGTLAVDGETAYTPWLTRQMVRVEDLVPGARVMVWKDGETAKKVIVFAYAYQGWVGMTAAGNGDVLACVNGYFDGQTPQCQGKRTADGSPLLPIRAVAEAAGYDVRWDKELKAAVVSKDGQDLLTAKPGEDVIVTPEGESGVSSPCVIEAGVTYLPAADLAYWLNLFLSTAV